MGSTTLQIALAVIFVIATAYAAGRVHQWHRHTFERDVAYREGYNQASRTLFHLAARNPSAKSEQLTARIETLAAHGGIVSNSCPGVIWERF